MKLIRSHEKLKTFHLFLKITCFTWFTVYLPVSVYPQTLTGLNVVWGDGLGHSFPWASILPLQTNLLRLYFFQCWFLISAWCVMGEHNTKMCVNVCVIQPQKGTKSEKCIQKNDSTHARFFLIRNIWQCSTLKISAHCELAPGSREFLTSEPK